MTEEEKRLTAECETLRASLSEARRRIDLDDSHISKLNEAGYRHNFPTFSNVAESAVKTLDAYAERITAVTAERDTVQGVAHELIAERDSLHAERDALRAEVARLRRCVRCGYPYTITGNCSKRDCQGGLGEASVTQYALEHDPLRILAAEYRAAKAAWDALPSYDQDEVGVVPRRRLRTAEQALLAAALKD